MIDKNTYLVHLFSFVHSIGTKGEQAMIRRSGLVSGNFSAIVRVNNSNRWLLFPPVAGTGTANPVIIGRWLEGFGHDWHTLPYRIFWNSAFGPSAFVAMREKVDAIVEAERG